MSTSLSSQAFKEPAIFQSNLMSISVNMQQDFRFNIIGDLTHLKAVNDRQ